MSPELECPAIAGCSLALRALDACPAMQSEENRELQVRHQLLEQRLAMVQESTTPAAGALHPASLTSGEHNPCSPGGMDVNAKCPDVRQLMVGCQHFGIQLVALTRWLVWTFLM